MTLAYLHVDDHLHASPDNALWFGDDTRPAALHIAERSGLCAVRRLNGSFIPPGSEPVGISGDSTQDNAPAAAPAQPRRREEDMTLTTCRRWSASKEVLRAVARRRAGVDIDGPDGLLASRSAAAEDQRSGT